jgi:hypothetical protein
LIVLDPEDSSHDLHPSCRLRWPGRRQSSPPATRRSFCLARAQGRDADSSLGTGPSVVAEFVPWLVRCWREHRLVRPSTTSVMAALLLVVAFVLVTRGTGGGPACDGLTGAGLIAPSSARITAAAVPWPGVSWARSRAPP